MTDARGGARPGAGRKPDQEQKIYVRIRLTPEQRKKLKQLGGSKWIGERIDKAAP